MSTHGAPPQNIESERIVIGACLIGADVIDHVLGMLSADDFYKPAHRSIYEAIEALASGGDQIDIITVSEQLHKEGQIDVAGGDVYLASLIDVIPVGIKDHCLIVYEHSFRRRAITALTKVVSAAYNMASPDDILDAIADAQIGLPTKNSGEPVPVSKIVPDVFEEVLERSQNKGLLYGMSTGLALLDKRTGGIHKSEYVVIAGRPGQGKTALALKFAASVAQSGECVLIFSLEMAKKRLVLRQLATGAKVDAQKMRTGFVSEEEIQRLTMAAGNLAKQEIYIDDEPALSIGKIRSRAKRLAAQHPLGMIIVDYMQLSRAESSNRALEVGQISAGLLGLAKELDVSMVALSQLNRGVEMRQDKRPVISDLRDSGTIEQDADTILLLYRDEYYDKSEGNLKRGTAEIIIGKGRDIGTGTVVVGFRGERAEFFDLDISR